MGSSPAQATSMLKDKAALFKRADDNLFGKEFREYLADSLKERKQENEVVFWDIVRHDEALFEGPLFPK